MLVKKREFFVGFERIRIIRQIGERIGYGSLAEIILFRFEIGIQNNRLTII